MQEIQNHIYNSTITFTTEKARELQSCNKGQTEEQKCKQSHCRYEVKKGTRPKPKH